ncbi:hypothetical protein D3C77_396540 [compost metagenome]
MLIYGLGAAAQRNQLADLLENALPQRRYEGSFKFSSLPNLQRHKPKTKGVGVLYGLLIKGFHDAAPLDNTFHDLG